MDAKSILPVAVQVPEGGAVCDNCPYFKLRADLQENPQFIGAGECRRFPPKVFFNQVIVPQPTGRIIQGSAEMTQTMGYQMQMQSPLVKNDFFCGEHPELRAQAELDAADARMDALHEAMPKLAEEVQKLIYGVDKFSQKSTLN